MTPVLTTPVAVEALPFRLVAGDSIVSLGSCFADEVAARLADSGFRVEQNPFGTLYNPASVASALDRLIDDRELTAADLVHHEGLWHSWHHHGSFSRPTADECLAACNTRIHRAHEALLNAKLLIVTFGTAWVYSLSSSLAVVANCHKLPQQYFVRRRMSADEVAALWQPLLARLSSFNSQLATVFTVSPIRHMADGAHGNQLSKATLLLAVDQLITHHQSPITYFPAYEIVLDELRDYRFFGADMTHPTPLASDIVFDRFEQATMSPATRQMTHNNRKAAKYQRHTPFR